MPPHWETSEAQFPISPGAVARRAAAAAAAARGGGGGGGAGGYGQWRPSQEEWPSVAAEVCR